MSALGDFVVYGNQNATRNQPLSPQLLEALSFLPELGLRAEVFSGGQPAIGTSDRRVGSTRHDDGGAADLFFYRGNERLNWANPEHLPVFEEIVRRGRAAGITGFGAGPGYMTEGSMHVGFGAPAVWGADGSGANAPEWLRRAFSGAEAGPAPTAVAGGSAPMGLPMALPAEAGADLGLASLFAAAPAMPVAERRQARQAEADKRREALFGMASLF